MCEQISACMFPIFKARQHFKQKWLWLCLWCYISEIRSTTGKHRCHWINILIISIAKSGKSRCLVLSTFSNVKYTFAYSCFNVKSWKRKSFRNQREVTKSACGLDCILTKRSSETTLILKWSEINFKLLLPLANLLQKQNLKSVQRKQKEKKDLDDCGATTFQVTEQNVKLSQRATEPSRLSCQFNHGQIWTSVSLKVQGRLSNNIVWKPTHRLS